jgi:hypothetical protein
MSEEPEYPVKPLEIKNRQQFEEMALEILGGWTDYKKIKTRMELLDASCKAYMVKNDMKTFENENGAFCIVVQERRILDRALIDDIEKYKINARVNIMYKSPNLRKIE